MKSDKIKAHWDAAYNSKDPTAVSWYQAQTSPSTDLICHHSPEKYSRIIDIGAGASRLVDELVKQGYSRLTLFDVSQAALDLSAERLGQELNDVRFVCADVTKWHPDIVFDVWHDRAVFHFLTTDEEQVSYLNALRRATTTGSIVIIGTFALHGPEKCSGLPVQRYSVERLQERLGDDFMLVASIDHIHVTPAGTKQPFTFGVFRRI